MQTAGHNDGQNEWMDGWVGGYIPQIRHTVPPSCLSVNISS